MKFFFPTELKIFWIWYMSWNIENVSKKKDFEVLNQNCCISPASKCQNLIINVMSPVIQTDCIFWPFSFFPKFISAVMITSPVIVQIINIAFHFPMCFEGILSLLFVSKYIMKNLFRWKHFGYHIIFVSVGILNTLFHIEI